MTSPGKRPVTEDAWAAARRWAGRITVLVETTSVSTTVVTRVAGVVDSVDVVVKVLRDVTVDVLRAVVTSKGGVLVFVVT